MRISILNIGYLCLQNDCVQFQAYRERSIEIAVPIILCLNKSMEFIQKVCFLITKFCCYVLMEEKVTNLYLTYPFIPQHEELKEREAELSLLYLITSLFCDLKFLYRVNRGGTKFFKVPFFLQRGCCIVFFVVVLVGLLYVGPLSPSLLS